MTEVSKDSLTIFQITGQRRSRQLRSILEGTGSSSQDFDAKGCNKGFFILWPKRELFSRVQRGKL